MLEIEQSQRYYYFVALKGSRGIIAKDFLRRAKIRTNEPSDLTPGCTAQVLRIRSDIRHHRGDVDYSVNRNDGPPYEFDSLALDYPSLDLTILGFPFKNLAIETINKLIVEYNLLSKSYFIKVDMDKLLHSFDEHTDLYKSKNHFALSGIFLNVVGDSFLSTVKLEGEKPLDSDIYKKYFRRRMGSAQCRLEKCILKGTVGINPEMGGRVVSSLHIDKFGNYKLYVHSKGKNLLTVPSIFDFLNDQDCLTETPNNPISHIRSEES